MAEFASKGVAGTGLGLGIAGTALSLLNGGLSGMVGGGVCGENTAVNRYEMKLTQELAAKDAKIGLLESQVYVDQKLTDVVKDYTAQINALKAQMGEQAVYNATMNGAISCIQGQVAQLMGLTRLVVPNGSVCPGWGEVKVSPAAGTPAA